MKPLKFHPQLRETLWGGQRIAAFKGDKSCDNPSIGESWELSGLRKAESVVRGGEYDGVLLSEVIRQRGEELVGKPILDLFGTEFPLLIKFIDAHETLSIQVHPNDELAYEWHGQRGKSEMWYVLSAEPGSQIYCGFNEPLTPERYDELVEQGRITEVLQSCEAKAGDLFYLPAGRIHSIGSGLFVVEIQQSCDLTYRVDDFNRLDKQGHPRELHTAQARRALDFNATPEPRTPYVAKQDEAVGLVKSPYFTTYLHDLTRPEEVDLHQTNSFVALVVLSGSGTLWDNEGTEVSLLQGETILIPASTNHLRILPDKQGLKYLACSID